MKVLKMFMLMVLSLSLWTCEDFTLTKINPAKCGSNFEIAFNDTALQKSREIIITGSPVAVEFKYISLQIRNSRWQEIYAIRLTGAELGNIIRLHLDDTTIILNIQTGWDVDGNEQIESAQETLYLNGYRKIVIDIIPPAGVVIDINEPAVTVQGENITIGVFDNWESAFRIVFATEAFRAKFPGISIQLKTTDYGSHHERLLNRLAAGSGANDIELADAAMVDELAAAGGLTDLAAAPYNGMAVCGELAPYAVANGTTVDGKFFAVPVNASPLVLYWRKSIADAAGIDFTGVNDWQEYIAGAAQLTGDTNGDGVIDQYAVTHPVDLALIPLNGGRGDWFVKGEPYVPEQGFIDALTLAGDVRAAGIDANLPPWSGAWMDSFKNNRVVTMFGGVWVDDCFRNWMCPGLAGDWRVSYPPGNAYASSGGSFITLPEQTAAGKKALAWEIIKYLCTNPEAQLSNLKSLYIFPVLTTVYNDPLMDEQVSFYGGQQIYHIFRDICLKIPARKVSSKDKQAVDIFTNAVYAVIDYGVPAARAYATAKQEMLDQM